MSKGLRLEISVLAATQRQSFSTVGRVKQSRTFKKVNHLQIIATSCYTCYLDLIVDTSVVDTSDQDTHTSFLKKMESSSTSKLGPNLGPKLGPNTGPKLGPNTGPKLGPNKGPKLENNGPKLQSGPRIGIHGLPIGPGRPGTQKMANPCNLFKNTQNTEGALNTEKVSNVDFALNTERNITFKSNHDILQLLKTHPDFERIPPDQLQPFVAAVLSGTCNRHKIW